MAPHHILLAATVAMLWGWDFIFAKTSLAYLPPFLFTTLRFLLVGLLVVPFVAMPKGKQWVRLLELSFVLCTLHFTFLFKGLSTNLDIPTLVITGQLSTPFACILGVLIFRERLSSWRTLGMVVAFVGIIVAAVGIKTETVPGDSSIDGFFLIMGASLMFAIANLIMKRMEGIPHMSMVGWMSLLAAPQIILLSLIFESNQWNLLADTPLSAISGLAYSAICSTIVAYSIWYALLSRYSVNQVVPFGLLVPVFGTIGSQIFLDDPLKWATVIGGMITIAGVAIIILPRPHFVRPPAQAAAE